jgi:PAS domain S-box-containing protein
VVITNLEGHIEYVNPKFTALTGYTAEEALGNNPRILKSGAQDDAYYSELWSTISAGNVWRGQFQNRKKNGELYWEAATISPIRDLNGVITHFLAVKEDITESVKNLDRVKKLLDVEEEQNKRLRNFTHIVSHNLRSHTANMAGVFGLLTIEEPKLLENLYVRMLKTSADNLSETIVNLNAVLDINLGNNVTWSFQNLNSAAKTAMSSISTLAETKGVKLINDISDDFTLFVIPAYLDSILLNMLTNGIKFRGPDRDAYVRLSATKDGKRTVITVEDNGLGVDLEIHGAKMFGLYKTFHQNTDSKGLGLFITKNQIEAMGGTIIVNSKVDVGTTFVITLPNEKF